MRLRDVVHASPSVSMEVVEVEIAAEEEEEEEEGDDDVFK